MKKHIYFLKIAIIALLFTGCTENDDEFFAATTVISNNLIEVNASGNQVNVSCFYPRILPQTGGNPFDLYLTTTSRKFFFNYTLEKKNANGVWEFIAPSNITVIEGENQVGSYISGIPVLDALDTNYEYEVDIPLMPGQYRIKIEPEIASLNSENAVMVTIKTTTVGIPSNTLEFTVN